jgi:hypothetical protein
MSGGQDEETLDDAESRAPQAIRSQSRGDSGRLLAEMLIEKLGNLAERDGGLGQAIVEQVLRV